MIIDMVRLDERCGYGRRCSMTTTTPRPHAEMAARYMSDDSLKCFAWNEPYKQWCTVDEPCWQGHLTYHVGHEAPTAPPKRQITVAGITFDEPETEAPIAYSEFWTFSASGTQCVWKMIWVNAESDFERLRNGLVHTTQEAAALHSEALVKLNRQLCGMEDSE